MLEYRISRNLKTINRLNDILSEKKGKCLSKRFITIKSKLKFQCKFNHTWEATANSLIYGKTWCPDCANKIRGKKRILKNGLENVIKIAAQKGGMCLSDKYINARAKLVFQCKNKHVFKMTPDNLKRNWCRKCSARIKDYTIEDMHAIAHKKGGKFLSSKYLGSRVKHKWQCGKGHIWFSAPTNLLSARDTWCPTCIGRNKTIQDLNLAAKKKGGWCLAKKYEGVNKKVKWKCSEGHTWMATPAQIMRTTSWCPKCHGFFKEELCRVTFEEIFNEKFVKIRPKWLISSSNSLMELDGYCKKLNIAFEYHGEQHFKKNHWIKSDEDLEKRFKDDDLKETLCKKNGVILIVITYKNDLLKLNQFIKKKLIQENFNVSQFNFEKFIDFNKAYRHKPKIQEMREVAIQKGGLCLSEKYIDIHTHLKWQCSKGHIWNAPPDSVKNGNHWCPKCAGNAKHTIEEIKIFAEKKGGKCLSKECRGAYDKLEWECNKGHVWTTTVNQVLNNKSWCPKCSNRISAERRSLGLDTMIKFAKDKNGKCLSTNYVNAHTKLRFICNKGHIFTVKPMYIRARGTWCKECKKNNNA